MAERQVSVPGTFIDSGGVYGTIPSIRCRIPAAREQKSRSTTAPARSCTVHDERRRTPRTVGTGGDSMNTGFEPFALGPVYISHSPRRYRDDGFDYYRPEVPCRSRATGRERLDASTSRVLAHALDGVVGSRPVGISREPVYLLSDRIDGTAESARAAVGARDFPPHVRLVWWATPLAAVRLAGDSRSGLRSSRDCRRDVAPDRRAIRQFRSWSLFCAVRYAAER